MDPFVLTIAIVLIGAIFWPDDDTWPGGLRA